jgi:hypothetical protein
MPVFKTGEFLAIGHMTYKVHESWYAGRLSSNTYLNRPPDATYLFVSVSVGNNDKEERAVPPFKLVDENGAEYGASDKAWAAEGSIGLLHDLNPGVSKSGYVIFDVPTNHQYMLKVSGGFWSTENAVVKLGPKFR